MQQVFLWNSSDIQPTHFIATFFTLVTTSLYNVQIGLENPFDMIGVDNLQLTLEKDYADYGTIGPFAIDPTTDRCAKDPTTHTCTKTRIQLTNPTTAVSW